MGISVQDSGIAVEKGRYYLVNLNADPSLNEMLVYYLKVNIEILMNMVLRMSMLHFFVMCNILWNLTFS